MLKDFDKQMFERLKNMDEFVLAIDGYAGSGKTTLAKELSRKLDATLINMDNFYLPIDKRTDDWFEKPGGNIDFVRLKNEIIIPYLNKENLKHIEFIPKEQYLKTFKDFKYNTRIIIEGSYSMHPEIFDFSNYKLFLKCDETSQEKRLKTREKDNYINFKNIWIVKELNYHKECHIEEKADLIIDTSNLF